MRVGLVNPPWRFEKSIYFGCTAPHLPLELAYAARHLREAGHEVQLFDGHLFGQTDRDLAESIAGYAPDVTVLTTAPTYLFWRCAQPELRVPAAVLRELSGRGGMTVAVGPHGSTTPRATLEKLGVDVVVRGECEEVLPEILARGPDRSVSGIAFRSSSEVVVTGAPRAARFIDEPPVTWPQSWISAHGHHHHRFNQEPVGPGAEVEASRGCPFTCTFCAKLDFRDRYRRRDRRLLLAEIDGLISQGVRYLYFIDEIFLPDAALLTALAQRDISFGIQTRIDLWKPELIELLGRAGCVSIEAGVESLSVEGRAHLDKRCKLTTDAITELLITARRHVPFVQANLILSDGEDLAAVARWRKQLAGNGVWANDPVPLFPYPGSPDYHKLFGVPDEEAWERAHAHYLNQFDRLSDIQDERPLPLSVLEVTP